MKDTKLNLISDLFARVVFQDRNACQELVTILLGPEFVVEDAATLKIRLGVGMAFIHYAPLAPIVHDS